MKKRKVFTVDMYKYDVQGNKVVAKSHFAGKEVCGVAKCNPGDEFNLEKGKELAAARCDQKIVEKRIKRSKTRKAHIQKSIDDAIKYIAIQVKRMKKEEKLISADSRDLDKAKKKIERLLNDM